ncbi:hypothetical protein VNN36_08210 [Lactococcus garvieae]|uniref:hypothetical protein n=1 Tax=Lactococcus garvieae TaxID=1363 RepID=UPI0030CEBCBE
MAWKQKVSPNVNVPGYSGGCLAYVDDGVNPPQRQATAQMSWQYAVDTKVAHAGEEPPTGIWVPVYYSINNGPWAGYGHVVWYHSVHGIYDSEFGCGNRSVPYSSGQDLFNYMGWQMSYLGWSEMVDGIRIVEKAEDNNNGTNSNNKGDIKMYLIEIVDKTGKHKGKWYISDGVSCRYVRTPRMLKNYRNEFGKLNLRVDKMYSSELFTEFGGEQNIK